MKIFKSFTVGLVLLFAANIVNAQSLTYSSAENLLSSEQKSVLDKAEKFISKANANISKAEAIEKKYSKKKKKKKKKKYEKKTWEAKKFRILAEKSFLKAYQDAYSTYSELIAGATYFDDNDKLKTQRLSDEAASLLQEANDKMLPFNKKVSKKSDLKKLSSSKLNSAISDARGKKESAFSKLKTALDVVISQQAKKEETEKDERAWTSAKNINTITSYQDYVKNFPFGKYANEARQIIAKLKAELANSAKSNYLFKVQIAASEVDLPDYELASRYPDVSEIEKEYSDGFYKYRVKSFSVYSKAAAFRDELIRTTVPDAFIVVFDKSGTQIEVTEEMKTN